MNKNLVGNINIVDNGNINEIEGNQMAFVLIVDLEWKQ